MLRGRDVWLLVNLRHSAREPSALCTDSHALLVEHQNISMNVRACTEMASTVREFRPIRMTCMKRSRGDLLPLGVTEKRVFLIHPEGDGKKRFYSTDTYERLRHHSQFERSCLLDSIACMLLELVQPLFHSLANIHSSVTTSSLVRPQ